MCPINYLLIANPQNRRVTLFQNALHTLGYPPATVLPYQTLLNKQTQLNDWVQAGTTVRIESPGEDFAVEKCLLSWGATAAEAEGSPYISQTALQQQTQDFGRILHPRQWYLGYQHWLQQLQLEGDALGVRWMSHPEDIVCLFDKPVSQAKIAAAQVPVPTSLSSIMNFEDLLAHINATGMQRVFVKLAHGSSASGVVALQIDAKKRMRATTSVEMVRQAGQLKLYNSLKIRHYTQTRDIVNLINTLCAECVQVEQWLPKARVLEGQFDLRILVINDVATLQVMRVSRSPMTNLHLGNQRGDIKALRHSMGEGNWIRAMQCAERAAQAFPRTLHVGVDLLIQPNLAHFAVLEANAFGDLLPNLYYQGKDSYEHEILAWVASKL